jgi:Spy/CpxP family protein refolding chaperone
MGKAKFILTLLFILTLSSGLVAGMLVSRLPAVVPATSSQRTPFAEILQLTDAQNEKMRVIWEGVRNQVDDCFREAQNVQKDRDDALIALLNDEQKVKFAKIQKETAAALAKLKANRDAMFQQAVEETKKILTDKQKERYEEILQTRLGHGPGGGGPDWLSSPTPASMPSDGH